MYGLGILFELSEWRTFTASTFPGSAVDGCSREGYATGMSRVRAVIFDLDDTLHDERWAGEQAAITVAQDLAQRFGLEAEAIWPSYMSRASNFFRGLATADMGRSIELERIGWWRDTLAEFALHDAALAATCAAEYLRTRTALLRLFPGVEATLAALRGAGLRIGILSNGFAQTHHPKIEQLGLRPYCDAIVLAGDVGLVKPDPDLFRYASSCLAVDPSETVMVGDRYERDILGAKAAGMSTILFDPDGRFTQGDGPPPDLIVRSFDEILPAVLRWVGRYTGSCSGESG